MLKVRVKVKVRISTDSKFGRCTVMFSIMVVVRVRVRIGTTILNDCHAAL